MRLSRLRTWDERVQDDAEEQKDELNKQILDTYAQLEKYQSWDGIQELLHEEQQHAFRDIMNADPDTILLARERAKLIGKLLQRPDDLQKELTRLHEERNALEE